MRTQIIAIFFLLGCCFSMSSFGQCPSGNVIFTSQSQVDQFVADYPNCTEINGNLEITTSSVQDISGLSSLRIINGHLKLMDTWVPDFTGLSFLEEIRGGYTEIRNNNSIALISLENLRVMNSNMSIHSNSALVGISGFDQITDMPSIEISHNFSLLSVPEFNQLTTTGELSFSENENLVTISGFNELTCLSSLNIHGNDVLENIPQFNKLERVTGFSFRISVNPYLKSAEGFQSLEFVNNLLIIDSSGWQNDSFPISDFPELKEISGFLQLRTAITKINGFNKLEKVVGITISSTRATEIVGFESLKELFSIDIDDHVFDLASIDAFKNVEHIQHNFRLWNNRVLSNIDGFQKLRTIGGDFQLDSHFELPNVNFLRSLTSVGQSHAVTRFSLSTNLLLSDCNGLALLMQFGQLPDIVDIENNAGNCNDAGTIIANADRDNDGVLDTVDVDDDNDGIYDVLETESDLDVDNDRIPNRLDLNSDNDGCTDVNEAGLEDQDLDGMVGMSPVTVDATGAVTSSSMAYLPPNDLDGDSVFDFLDIAYSPVLTEQPASQSVVVGQSAVFEIVISNADVLQWEISTDDGVTWTDVTNGAVFSGMTTPTLTLISSTLAYHEAKFRLRFLNSSGPCASFQYTNTVDLAVINSSTNTGQDTTVNICPSDPPFDLFAQINGSPDPGGYWVPQLQTGTNIFDPTQNTSGVYRYYLDVGDCLSVYTEVTVNIEGSSPGLDGSLMLCETDIPTDLIGSLGGDPDSGGTWTPALASGTGIFDPSVDTAGTYTYTVGSALCGTSSAEVEVQITAAPNAGSDGNITLCPDDAPVDLFDLLSDNPDTGGVWGPTLASGTGVFDPAVDAGGIYFYTVSNSICGAVSAQVEVILEIEPNAGTDGNLTVCSEDAPIDLFLSLGNNPDGNGTWSPALSSGTGLFDPTLDTAGTYTYTVTNSLCGSSSSEVVVQIDARPSAGTNGVLDICANSTPLDLFDFLGGNPTAGGVWSPSLASGTGLFDPTIDTPGMFQYSIGNGVCPEETAMVEVRILELPNAGENGTLSICSGGDPVDLFDLLGGTPDANGSWSPTLASGTSIFNPTMDAPGIYTYTVSNSLCESVSSQVTVDTFNTYEITNFEIQTTDFEAENYARVLINEPGEYEYSLDNISFQSSNAFLNLSGGDYMLYVRQVNGCGRLQKEFSILEYPKFFTPNGDGHNDHWKLKGSTAKPYSIYIYNRFGKLMKILKNSNEYWTGLYNGRVLPSSDYWFVIKFEDGTTKRGNFALLRNN